MKASLAHKLDGLAERLEEISALLAEPDVIADQDRFRELSREYAQIEPVVRNYATYQQALADREEAQSVLTDSDPDMVAMAESEIASSDASIAELEAEFEVLLLPTDPRDKGNVYLEVRAGTGGDEAAIFAGDLFRMYSRYAENQGWSLEMVSANEGEHGGFKQVIARIVGDGAYSRLKFESGAHRVQRVPATESQGRIHTSACTVAILPEVDDIDDITINPADLRIDTYRSSGAGGQHVNTTDSAIRITHLPTGTVVECQDERSQHKNKARAMSLLKARILDQEQSKRAADQAAERKSLVGSGDRSERIRTYNFPQGRVTDHRINLTLYQLDDFVTGNLDPVIEPLIQEHRAEQLAAIGEE